MNSNILNNAERRNNERKNFYAIAIILITVIIWFFVTSDFYVSYLAHSEENTMTENKAASLNKELNSLNEKKKQFENDKLTQKLINQFAWEYREDLIINQLYASFTWVTVDSLSMDKWQKLPNWLSLANITVSVSAKDVKTLNSFLDYLTSAESNIRFIIKNISFPLDSNSPDNPTQATVSLWMYYYSAK